MITGKDMADMWSEWNDSATARDLYNQQAHINNQKQEAQKMWEEDVVNHPKHYTNHPSGIECIEITQHMNFLMGNAMKYLWRADLKNGVEDLKKAAWYLNKEIETRLKDKNV